MKGDHTKFFVSQKYVKNTKFGSYLHHQHVSVLYSKQHRTLPSESWSVLSLSLLEFRVAPPKELEEQKRRTTPSRH